MQYDYARLPTPSIQMQLDELASHPGLFVCNTVVAGQLGRVLTPDRQACLEVSAILKAAECKQNIQSLVRSVVFGCVVRCTAYFELQS